MFSACFSGGEPEPKTLVAWAEDVLPSRETQHLPAELERT